MDHGHLRFEIDESVALVTLDRGERLHAISPALVYELLHALETTDSDDAVKVLVFTGNGRAFSA